VPKNGKLVRWCGWKRIADEAECAAIPFDGAGTRDASRGKSKGNPEESWTADVARKRQRPSDVTHQVNSVRDGKAKRGGIG